MHRIVHVTFGFDRAIKMRDLEPIFNQMGGDWIRYSVACWMMWTDIPTPAIYNVLNNNIDEKDNVLVTVIDLKETVGKLPPWAWNWLNSKNPSSQFATGQDVANALQAFLPYLPKMN